MPKARITPHRPARDTAHAKELAENKRLINQLTREVARLRRQLEKKGPQEPEEEPETLAGNDSQSPRADSNSSGSKVKSSTACPSCSNSSAGVTIMTTPSGKTVSVCNSCKFRKILDGPL